MVKQQHQLFVAILCLIDAIVIAAACYAAWVVRQLLVDEWWPRSWENWVKEPLVLIAVPVVLFMLWVTGLYRPRRDQSLWTEQGQLIKASLLALAAMVVVLWVIGNEAIGGQKGEIQRERWGMVLEASRVQFAALALLLPVTLCLHRASFRLVLREIRRRGRNLRHVAVVGVGRLGQIACRTIARNTWTGISVSYFISHEPEAGRAQCLTRPVRGGLDDLERTLEEHRVDAVYLALPNSAASELPSLLRRLERFPLDVRIIPDVPPRYLPLSMSVSELEGMPILGYRECPLYGLGGFSKRVLDLAGGLAALVVFAPVMLAVTIAVRLSGPGPVIFKQRRVSLGGEVFNIYKFRTMYHYQDEAAPEQSDGEASWTERDDPRITPVGRFLRRTSLDELPQLFNVLRGEMSLVGPRPERPELIERFKEDWRGYMLRQHVKAGMTGWAQVQGLRGDTSLKKRLQYDLFYIRHWSLGFDLKILWLTVFRGFVHRNAH